MARRKSAKPPAEPISITEIPLTVPDRTRRPPSSTGGKTLLDLIDERRAELGLLPDDNGKQTGSSKASPPLGKAVRIDGKDDSEVEEITNDELFGPVMQTVFYTVPLLTVLFCLDVLVYKQYRQEIIWEEIARRIAKSGPGGFSLPITLYSHLVNFYRRGLG